jgi:hypothetical protein
LHHLDASFFHGFLSSFAAKQFMSWTENLSPAHFRELDQVYRFPNYLASEKAFPEIPPALPFSKGGEPF